MCVSQVSMRLEMRQGSLTREEDTLYIMAGLGLLDMIGEDVYKADEVTQHLVAYPTKIHGLLHL